MSLWYLIPNDGPFPWSANDQREVNYFYLQQMVAAVDRSDFLASQPLGSLGLSTADVFLDGVAS
jgi:hypothetical protein